MRIDNKQALREYYELLNFCAPNPAFALKVKKAIREYHKRESEREKRLVIGVNRHDDSYIEVLTVPDDVTDIESWFKGNVYIPPYYTYYDCTGRAFTAWYRFGKRQGKRVVYHCVALDV